MSTARSSAVQTELNKHVTVNMFPQTPYDLLQVTTTRQQLVGAYGRRTQVAIK